MNQIQFSQRDLRLLLFHEFRQGNRITRAVENINKSMRLGVLTYETGVRWFKRFRANDFNIEDAPRSGRPVEVDLDELQEAIVEYSKQTARL